MPAESVRPVVEDAELENQMHTTTNDSSLGLYNKFNVSRSDGRSEAGEKHEGCEYFVLDLNHDPHAGKALRAYAESCITDYPQLASDLHLKIFEHEKRFQ